MIFQDGSFNMIMEAYTDGACKGNPGRGGWGWVLFSPYSNVYYFDYGGMEQTTNNIMELTAMIKLIENLSPGTYTIYTDSNYVLGGIGKGQYPSNGWIKKWKNNGWKTKKEVVKNINLWKDLDELLGNFIGTLSFEWVKGHSGDIGNDLADNFANMGCNL